MKIRFIVFVDRSTDHHPVRVILSRSRVGAFNRRRHGRLDVDERIKNSTRRVSSTMTRHVSPNETRAFTPLQKSFKHLGCNTRDPIARSIPGCCSARVGSVPPSSASALDATRCSDSVAPRARARVKRDRSYGR